MAAPKKKTSRRTKVAPASRGLAPAELMGAPPPAIARLADAVREDGGAVLATYREPIGGHWLLLVGLPVEEVEPTPYQRDLSETHLKRLGKAIEKVGLFLDPILATREGAKRYWTPNGNHRLAAVKLLGGKSIPALLVPDRELAFKILALNTEKAHNLKEKALEVIRMLRALAIDSDRDESAFGLEFEEPVLLTLGVCYEHNARFSGSVYRSPLLRVERFLDQKLPKALRVREGRAQALLALDEKVAAAVAALKARGLTSPYLKAFVVARVNPLRFAKDSDLTPEELIAKMTAAAAAFDAAKVKPEQISAAGGPPDAEE